MLPCKAGNKPAFLYVSSQAQEDFRVIARKVSGLPIYY